MGISGYLWALNPYRIYCVCGLALLPLLSIGADPRDCFGKGDYHTVFVGINNLHRLIRLPDFSPQSIIIIWIKIHDEGIVNMEGY